MIISLKNITKRYRYPLDTLALNNINIDFNKGELTAIMGKSGCGKSTLLNILGGLTIMDEGEYYYNNILLNFHNQKNIATFRRDNVGIIVQNFALINNRTAYENISLALSNKNIRQGKKLIQNTSQLLGMEKKLSLYPSQLSGGECQRIAIIRAIINNPNIILADEPTGALDSYNGQLVLDILNKLSKNGTTVIIVTHDKTIANQCEKVIMMKDGKINN